MKSKKKDVLLQFVKDEDVPFTMKLRSMGDFHNYVVIPPIRIT